MRILHLADLHLGKIVHEVAMTDDQAHVLEQIHALVREAAVEVVAITGDVYDRAIPPVQATMLMDDFLARLVLDLGVRVILTPGNHDSPERLSFGSRLLRERGLFIAPGLSTAPGLPTAPGLAGGTPPSAIQPITLHDAHGPVTFHPLPYISPVMLKETEDDLALGDFDEAMRRVMASLPRAAGRTVCLGHCFTLGGEGCESERPLSIGGASMVDPGHFRPFHLTLLGHLHRPQKVADTVFYAGSPLKYSFSEAAHTKSAALYDLAADGSFTRELVPLTPRRDLRLVTGALDELLAKAEGDPGREDYLWIELTDAGALFDYAAKLRAAYPGVLNITRTAYGTLGQGGEGGIEIRGKTEWEVTRAFFSHVVEGGLDEREEAVMRAVVDEMLRLDTPGDGAGGGATA